MHSSPRWTSSLRLVFSARGSLNLLLCPSTRGRTPTSQSSRPSRMLSIYSSPVIGRGDVLPALTWADTFSVADTVVWMVFWRGDCDWSDRPVFLSVMRDLGVNRHRCLSRRLGKAARTDWPRLLWLKVRQLLMINCCRQRNAPLPSRSRPGWRPEDLGQFGSERGGLCRCP